MVWCSVHSPLFLQHFILHVSFVLAVLAFFAVQRYCNSVYRALSAPNQPAFLLIDRRCLTSTRCNAIVSDLSERLSLVKAPSNQPASLLFDRRCLTSTSEPWKKPMSSTLTISRNTTRSSALSTPRVFHFWVSIESSIAYCEDAGCLLTSESVRAFSMLIGMS